MTLWSKDLIKFFSINTLNKSSHKVKSKVYFIFFNRCFGGEGFKVKQTNGSNFSLIHSAIPCASHIRCFSAYHYIIIGFHNASRFGFLLLIQEWPQVNHVEKIFGNDDGASLNTKILLLPAFLIFTMHWPILSGIILLLAINLPSSIDLLGLLTIKSQVDVSTETIWSDLELGKLLA